jgi:hypothetical protein
MLQFDPNKTIDPREPWAKFRRRELYAIAKINNVSFPPGAPATVMRQLLDHANVNPLNYNPTRRGPLHGDIGRQEYNIPKEMISQEIDDEPIEVKTNIEDVDVYALSYQQMKKWCREHGILTHNTDKKPDVIRKIKDYFDGQNVTQRN